MTILSLSGGEKMECEHTVSLCMIVKDEEACLQRCLKSVSEIVDEIIIVDTGSTDNTIKIAKDFGAIVKTFKWNDDFAEARNFSLSFATKDWILVLDADEYLRKEDSQKFIEALNDFNNEGYIIKTLNYTSDINVPNYVTNLNQRIFKNNKNYHYVGAIHEQLVPIDKAKIKQSFKIIDVGFYHTGYLSSVVKSKDKTHRNSIILKKILDEDPDNTFHLFNLANEYSQMGKLKEAEILYDQAYVNSTAKQGFFPKLVIFRLTNLITLGEIDKAYVAIEEGLKMYPKYTDLVFYKATLERSQGQVTKAIHDFKKCIEMGKPPMELEYQTLCYGYGPALCLAEIYQEYEDYEQAINYYNKCLSFNPSKYQLLYSLVSCYQSLITDSNTIITCIKKYLNLSNDLNQILFINLLIYAKYYEEAKAYLDGFDDLTNEQFIFLNGKIHFYTGNYDKSKEFFKHYLELIPHDRQVEKYLFLIKLLKRESLDGLTISHAYYQIKQFIQGNQIDKLTETELKDVQLKIYELLKELLSINNKDIVEKLTALLDSLSNVDYHIVMARYYQDNNQKSEAKHEIIKYILKKKDSTPEVSRLLFHLN